MIKDYHLHPQILTKPDWIHSFIRTAIEKGIDEICVTDHMPLSLSDAADRIPAGRVGEYCTRVRRLAEEYAGRISIRLGIEIDYHPSVTGEIEAVLEAGDFDYVIGSSHLHVAPADLFRSIRTYTEFAGAMLENDILAARSGYFDTLAHLDFFKWHFSRPDRFPLTDDGFVYERLCPLVEDVLDAVREEGIRLELNSHRLAHTDDIGWMYPEIWIAEMALEKGVRFAFGSDAHSPEHVGTGLDILHAHPVYGKALALWEEDSL